MTAAALEREATGNDNRARIGFGALGFLILFVAWEVAARAGWLNPVIVASPTRIAEAFARQWAAGALLKDLGVSMVEFALGFALSLVLGIALGFAMGLSRWCEYALDPFVWFIYAAPVVAIYPLLIVWLGFGFATVVAVTFLLSFVSIVVNALAGVHAVEPQLERMLKNYGGGYRDIVFKLVLPASVPHILAGARIGLGRALHGVVLGEIFGSNSGLGYSLTYYGAQLKTADVFVPLLVLVVLGALVNQASGWIEHRLLAWRRA